MSCAHFEPPEARRTALRRYTHIFDPIFSVWQLSGSFTGRMSTTEEVLREGQDVDTDGEDIEAFLPGRRTVTFDRSPKRQRVDDVPPATPPHVPRAPPVTQSPPGPPTAGGSSSDDESVPPAPRRKWAPPTAGFSSSDDEEEAPARPADDDTDDGGDAPAAALPAAAPPVAPPPPPPPAPAQTPAQRALACLESDAEAMGTTPHGFRRMPTLLLAAYRGDAAAVSALPLLFQRREIVIGLGMREEEKEKTGPERDSAVASSGHR